MAVHPVPARKFHGQCFLCQRDVTMPADIDSAGNVVYTCRHCGGQNSQARIEAGRDIRGHVQPEYCEIIELVEEA